MTRTASAALLFSVSLLPAAAALEQDPRQGEGPYSQETVGALDNAILRSAEVLLRLQAKDGSWEGDVAVTALAVQALAAVEPPTEADAAAVETGLQFIFGSKALKAAPASLDGAGAYALAYALAAAHVRPKIDDQSGLLGYGPRLRELLEGARQRGCTGFQKTIFLKSLTKLGASKDQLRVFAEALEKNRRGSAALACAALVPDPKETIARTLLRDIALYRYGHSSPRRVKRDFDDIIDQEERGKAGTPRSRKPGPLALSGLLWASVALTEMRQDLVEPKRGCLFSADLLASRLLEIRAPNGGWGEGGYRGASFGTASALALVHLRGVFADEISLRH